MVVDAGNATFLRDGAQGFATAGHGLVVAARRVQFHRGRLRAAR